MKHINGVALVSALLIALAGCGDRATGALGNPLPAATGNNRNTVARVTITIPLKNSSSSSRKPAYVSPATQSITVAVDAGAPVAQNLTPTSPNCSVPGPLSALTCTVDIVASPGTHTFTFTTYDQTGAAGSQLSVNSVTQTLLSAQVNLVNVTLAGVPKAISVLPAPNARVSGDQTNGLTYLFGASQPVIVAALDADGNFIVGPGAPSIRATISGTAAAHFSIASGVNGNPNAFGIKATTAGTATISITATPDSALAGSPLTVSVPVTSTVLITAIDANIAGSADGPASTAKLGGGGWVSGGISYDPNDGDLYFGDPNCSLRQVVPSGPNAGTITTIAGNPAGYYGCSAPQDGVGTSTTGVPSLTAWGGTAYDPDDGNSYFIDYMFDELRRSSPSGVVMTIAGSYSTSGCTYQDGTGTSACFYNPNGIAYDANDKNIYVYDAGDCSIRMVNVSANSTNGGVVTTIAGSMPPTANCGFKDGTGGNAQFSAGWSLTYDSGDGNLYVADTNNCAIRQVNPTTDVVKTIAGGTCGGGEVDGTGNAATFNKPYGITYDSSDGNLYVIDLVPGGGATNISSLRQVTPAGVVTTLVSSTGVAPANGYGSKVNFLAPASLTYDSANGMLYIYDYYTIRQVEL